MWNELRATVLTRVRLFAGLVIVVLLLGGTLFFAPSFTEYSEASTIAKNVRSFEDLQERFQNLARDKGAVYAYEILRRAELPTNTDLHLLGHAVGDILYEQEGVEGIAACTDDFRNACSHTIAIGALNEFGESALEKIRDACKRAPGGTGAYTMCFHGLGHGVFAYYGYEFSPTVEFCEKTGTPEYRNREYIECVGGSVMELMGGGGHNPRAWRDSREKYLDRERPLSPCMDSVIPREAKEICLVYLTPRLFEVAGLSLAQPQPDMFRVPFAYCDAIHLNDTELRDACYGGFGKEFAVLAAARDIRDLENMSDMALSNVIEWCRTAAPTDGQQACVRSALQSFFWGGENDPELSFRFCALTKPHPDLESACYRQLAEDIAQYKSDPEKRALCERVPSASQSFCESEV